MSNSMYWVTTFIFSMVLLIIHVADKSDKKNKAKAEKAFSVMLAYGIFFCIQDFFWGLCYSNIIKGDTTFFISSCVFHLSIVLTSYCCLNFFLSYLDYKLKAKRILIAVCVFMIIIQTVLVVSNFFTPVLFKIVDGTYVTGQFRSVSFITQYIVYLVSGFITFAAIRRADKKHREQYKAIFMAAIIPLITGLFQLYYPEAPFYSLGYFIECMIVYMFIITKDKSEQSQSRIIDAIESSYYSMHLFDIVENTMQEYIESEIVTKFAPDRKDAQQAIFQVMSATATEEYRDAILEFVDFSTLPDRLSDKNSITLDFIGSFHGWTRATFIPIEWNEEGKLTKVMYLTQIIDEQKKREKEMFAKSHIDSLTKLYNRRAYESDIADPVNDSDNLVYISIDVNELKVVNDNLGHEAGDELLIGAAKCMNQCFGPYGKVYRTGGDEFVVLIYASDYDLEHIKQDFEDTLLAWKGSKVDRVSVSSGYVTRREAPDLAFDKLAKMADERMYADKAAWYKSKGVDRRGQAAAHTALCNLYTKILKINLTKDTYSIVNMDVTEQTAEKGFADSISQWLHGFGKSGQVHPDDLEGYLAKTELDYLKEYFKSGKTSISIFYRRKYGEVFKQVAMEMIPADDYDANNQALFLYVKNIDI